MGQLQPEDMQSALEAISRELVELEAMLLSSVLTGEELLSRGGLLDAAREPLAESSAITRAVEEVVRACRSAATTEGLHPSSLSVVVDALTGAQSVVQSMTLREFDASLSARPPQAPSSKDGVEPQAASQIRFRRADTGAGPADQASNDEPGGGSPSRRTGSQEGVALDTKPSGSVGGVVGETAPAQPETEDNARDTEHSYTLDASGVSALELLADQGAAFDESAEPEAIADVARVGANASGTDDHDHGLPERSGGDSATPAGHGFSSAASEADDEPATDPLTEPEESATPAGVGASGDGTAADDREASEPETLQESHDDASDESVILDETAAAVAEDEPAEPHDEAADEPSDSSHSDAARSDNATTAAREPSGDADSFSAETQDTPDEHKVLPVSDGASNTDCDEIEPDDDGGAGDGDGCEDAAAHGERVDLAEPTNEAGAGGTHSESSDDQQGGLGPYEAGDASGGSDPNVSLNPAGGPDVNAAADRSGGVHPNLPLEPTGPDPTGPDPTGPEPTGPDPTGPDPTGLVPTGLTPTSPHLGEDNAGGVGAVDVQDADDEEWGSTPIALDSERAELLQFLVTDVRQATSEIDPIISELSDITSRPEAAERLVAMASGLAKVGEFFDFRTFTRLLDLLRVIGLGIDTVADEHLGELSLRLRGIGSLFDQFCSGLEVGMEMHWPLRTLERRIGHLLGGRSLHPDFTEYHRGDVDRVLEVDRVTEGIEPLPEPESETVARAAGSASPSAGAAPSGSSTATPTVRVPRDAIAELVSLVRQLVLNKNQFESIADEAGGWGLAVSRTEPLKLRASEYGRLIDQLQTTLNTARTQPVEVVVGRYERMVRDVAQIGDKSVHFLVEGGDVAVDKFVLDAIADPIGRLLRRTVSSEIETTADRAAAGKPETATISVTTSDHGSHVVIELSHDGREPNPSEIREHARALSPAGVAVEALADEYLLAAVHRGWMTDSDTAGVAELVEAQGGTLSVACDSGLIRTRLSLPVEGAVMSMMYVGIGDGAYAVPVSNIREVVPLHTCTLSNVKGERIARIRDSIFPVVDGAERFGAAGVGERRIAVILSIDGYSAALLVERMLGQQEVVLEPLGLDADQCGPFLGATILNSGSVGLAIDVRALLAV